MHWKQQNQTRFCYPALHCTHVSCLKEGGHEGDKHSCLSLDVAPCAMWPIFVSSITLVNNQTMWLVTPATNSNRYDVCFSRFWWLDFPVLCFLPVWNPMGHQIWHFEEFKLGLFCFGCFTPKGHTLANFYRFCQKFNWYDSQVSPKKSQLTKCYLTYFYRSPA